jgi:hypothetical protein
LVIAPLPVTRDAPRSYRFTPEVGPWRIEFTRLARSLREPSDVVFEKLDREVEDTLALVDGNGKTPTLERLKFAFSLSLLSDLIRSGGRVQVMDSEVFVSWPDWEADDARAVARRAFEALVERRQPSETERRAFGSVFAENLDAETLLEFLSDGEFWLEPADSRHPSGVRYGDAFSVALRLWSMPYRGREGRMRRFVVVGSHKRIFPSPVVVGLIEVGDDAPYSSERDAFLGLRSTEFLAWIEATPDRAHAAAEIAERFSNLRQAVLPPDELDPRLPASTILSRASELLAMSSGRSRHDEDFVDKKRVAYLLRLAQGERAMARLGAGEELQSDDADLREGVRAVHNITVPRMHMEVTVCGGLPPFTVGLAGKLVVAFLGHPEIIELGRTSTGSILLDVFDKDLIADLLPDHGLLAITTKGLYPGHSALYNRAVLPGPKGPLRLRHIGDTRGSTTALLHNRTGKLAKLVVAGGERDRRVSLVYGTGGAKRQRSIQSASLSIGLPSDFAHAGIHRPIYGIRFASNVEEVIWRGAAPAWNLDRAWDSSEYSRRAVDVWRQRWLGTSQRRLLGHGKLSGVLDALTETRLPDVPLI